MSFLQPWLLAALPLVLLPIVIHLIHMHRRKAVRWAAMMFLRAAQRMNQGLSKLRQYLILAMRVLAIAALILMAGRPLAGGLLGLTGGAPDLVLLLVDRSASMEQQDLTSGVSKRLAGLTALGEAVDEAYGSRSRLMVIDSATLEPVEVEGTEAMLDLPALQPTETAADIPGLLQSALDLLSAQGAGRADVWLLSDLRQADWNSTSGKWAELRAGFSSLPGLRFHLLNYPDVAPGNLSIQVERALRRGGSGRPELLIDLKVVRQAGAPEEPIELPLRVTVNGVTSVVSETLRNQELQLRGYRIPLDGEAERGWGWVELPADSNAADNRASFVFDRPPPLRSVVVSDREELPKPLAAALQAPLDPGRKYLCEVLSSDRVAEIEWEEVALVVWQLPIPVEGSVEARLLEDHARSGRTLLFLPPDRIGDHSFLGSRWQGWEEAPEPASVTWWRTDSGLLSNTQDGEALAVGELEWRRWSPVEGEGVALARMENDILLLRSSDPDARQVWWLGSWPEVSSSSLARDGVVQFALLHRALEAGASALGQAQRQVARTGALGEDPSAWSVLGDPDLESMDSRERALRCAVFEFGQGGGDSALLALNRPLEEDAAAVLEQSAVEELFADLDIRWIESRVTEEQSLASEIWRTFLWLMAGALLVEALLCLPGRSRPEPVAAGIS